MVSYLEATLKEYEVKKLTKYHNWIIGGETTAERIHRLATYNAERARGIEHMLEWKELMRKEQEWFNTEYSKEIQR